MSQLLNNWNGGVCVCVDTRVYAIMNGFQPERSESILSKGSH